MVGFPEGRTDGSKDVGVALGCDALGDSDGLLTEETTVGTILLGRKLGALVDLIEGPALVDLIEGPALGFARGLIVLLLDGRALGELVVFGEGLPLGRNNCPDDGKGIVLKVGITVGLSRTALTACINGSTTEGGPVFQPARKPPLMVQMINPPSPWLLM